MQAGRILVVEDLPALGELIGSMLRLHGHDCVGIAATASEAMRLARSSQPELALVDLVLRNELKCERAGLRVARLLNWTHGVPSLFVPAAPQWVRPGFDCCGVLEKPFRMKTLLLAVAATLRLLRTGQISPDLPQGLTLWLRYAGREDISTR